MSKTNNSKTSQTKAEQRAQTRSKTLQAVLDIIAKDGMRAVRHRAVAERAGVSLGTTTYYFSSIEDLIISAFTEWRGRSMLAQNPYYQAMEALMSEFKETLVLTDRRAEVAQSIYQASVGYVLDQVNNHQQDRIIELAFYHESMHYPSLRENIIDGWQPQRNFLQLVHQKMGSQSPKDDADITFMLFRQFEQNAVMMGHAAPSANDIKHTLHRHMSLCFAVDISMNF